MVEAETPPKQFPKKMVFKKNNNKKKNQRLECFKVFTATATPAWGVAVLIGQGAGERRS